MFGGVLCLLMLIFVRNPKKTVFFTYLIYMFGFTCCRSSHETLLSDIKTDDLQNSMKSSVSVKLLYAYCSAKDKLLLKYSIRKFV